MSVDDYDDAVEEIEPLYIVKDGDLRLSRDPRLAAVFVAVDMNRPFSDTMELGVGLAPAVINQGDRVRRRAPKGEKSLVA